MKGRSELSEVRRVESKGGVLVQGRRSRHHHGPENAVSSSSKVFLMFLNIIVKVKVKECV